MILEVFDYQTDDAPLELFSVIKNKFGAPLALLESAQTDINNKFSIIAFNPIQEIITDQDPFDQLRAAIKKSKKFPKNFHFGGGLIGYFNFEVFNFIEPKVQKKSTKPVALFYEFSRFFIIDHEAQQIFAIQTTGDATNFQAENAEILKEMRQTPEKKYDFAEINNQKSANFDKFQLENTKDEFFEKIKWTKEKILDGDIFQMIVSNQFSINIGDYDARPFYDVLRQLEPSTHLFLLDFGKHGQVCGASPEILGSKRGEKVLYTPIAGTRFRGKNAEEDAKILQGMINDPKENAEHDMLVDLGRNDIGKICKAGSVKIIKEKYGQKFANVMHLVTDLEGEIDTEKYDAIDFFKAIFPAGTLSGAPKIRAIDLIYQIEENPRNLYGGAVGYFSADENMEFCIAIRSFFCQNNYAYFRTGAGVVQDSELEKEWLEVHNKAKSLCKIFNYVLAKK